MEENTMKVNEIEEYDQSDVEVEEALDESSGGGSFVAGIVGGFLAYAVIGGAKKLAAFAQMKLAERKLKEASKTVVDAEYTEVHDRQEDSGEETSEEE